MREYVVQRGDTLWSIAQKNLGHGHRWQEIAQLNFTHDPKQLFIGEKLRLPDDPFFANTKYGMNKPLTLDHAGQRPASLVLARGFMLVLFEQLPEVGKGKIIRKMDIAVIPKDFSILPRNPFGNMSLADHAMKSNPPMSQYLSGSIRPLGAPNFNGMPLLLDVAKIEEAGGRVFSVSEVVNDLKRFARENPHARAQVNYLISTIENIEGEVLVEGGAPAGSVKKLGKAHLPYVKSAEQLWEQYVKQRITRDELINKLNALEKQYAKARMVGRVGRVLTVIGVVFTVADLSIATKQSIDQKSFRPIGVESVKQASHWGGVIGGMRIGFTIGAAFGIETGPGAIITGAIGAFVFGAIAYFSADWLLKSPGLEYDDPKLVGMMMGTMVSK